MMMNLRLAANVCRAYASPVSRRMVAARTFTATARVFEQYPRVRIGSTAPNFEAVSTKGKLDLHDYIDSSWVIFFSHPADFTPVCTTELGAFAALEPEFNKRGAKLLGLSANGIEQHDAWVKDIEETSTGGAKVNYPIIADADRKIALLYDMLDEDTVKNLDKIKVPAALRSVFIIDPKKKIRATITYPPSVGRNTSEVLRVLDSLQLTDASGVVTPVNWSVGDDVIIPPTVSNEDAKSKYGSFKEVKPYLRFTQQPKTPLKSSVIPINFGKRQFSWKLRWDPAFTYIILLILFGSQALSVKALKEQYSDLSLKYNTQIDILKDVVKRLRKGEDVDVAKELGTNVPEQEEKWQELFAEITSEDSYFKQGKEDKSVNASLQSKESSQVKIKPSSSNFF